MPNQDSKPNPLPLKDPIVQHPKAAAKRRQRPAWMQQLPKRNFPPQDDTFELISAHEVQVMLATEGIDTQVIDRVVKDVEYLNGFFMRLFRERDYEASYQQNRYWSYQITYVFLATAATIVGSLQSLALGNNPYYIPILAFAETVIALIVTYFSTLATREPPLDAWMVNRGRSEALRQECFRFLARLPPYDALQGYQVHVTFNERAGNINRGILPPESDKVE